MLEAVIDLDLVGRSVQNTTNILESVGTFQLLSNQGIRYLFYKDQINQKDGLLVFFGPAFTDVKQIIADGYYIRIEIAKFGEVRGDIQFGHNAHFILFAGIFEGTLYLKYDWRSFFSKGSLNASVLAAYLAYGQKPTQTTPIDGVYRIFSGTRLTFSATEISVEAADTLLDVERFPIRPGANVSGSIFDILCHSVARRAFGDMVVELSGGIDSALIGVAAAQQQHRPKTTFGLIYDGAPGQQQRARRSELIEKFEYDDVAISAKHGDPFEYSIKPRLPLEVPDVWDCPYYSRLERFLAIQGVHGLPQSGLTVFNGLGGDELCGRVAADFDPKYDALLKNEMGLKALFHDHLPAPLTSYRLNGDESAVFAAMLQTRPYMSRGCMPVSVLCDPEIYAFFRQLPISSTSNKSILRQVLKEQGLSDYFVYPSLTEDFSGLFWKSYQRFDLVSFFKGDTYLGDLRVMDTKKIAEKVNKSSMDYYIPLTLLAAVRAEHWLRLVNNDPRMD